MTPKFCFDLDGVLADFTGAALAHHGASLPPHEMTWNFPDQIGFAGRLHEFWNPLGKDFWESLPILEDGFRLLDHIASRYGRKNVCFVSSPCGTEGCEAGKKAWVKKHLPDFGRQYFFGSEKHFFAGPGKVLVDDNDGNLKRFECDEDGHRTGGLSLCVPRHWNCRKADCDPSGSFCTSSWTAAADAELREYLK